MFFQPLLERMFRRCVFPEFAPGFLEDVLASAFATVTVRPCGLEWFSAASQARGSLFHQARAMGCSGTSTPGIQDTLLSSEVGLGLRDRKLRVVALFSLCRRPTVERRKK